MFDKTPESESHSQSALEYKNLKRQEISDDLNRTVDEYGDALPTGIKSKIINNVERIVDLKISDLKESYTTMRATRGEVIMIQDIDDYMPYVRLAMLQELLIQLSNQNIANTDRLAQSISELEKEIAKTKGSVDRLRSELDIASKESTNALEGLTKTPEYTQLGKAYIDVGKNKGALKAWKEVKNIPMNGDLTKNLDTYITSTEREIKAQEETIGTIQEILGQKMANLNPAEVDEYKGKLRDKINALSKTDAISQELFKVGEELVKVLGLDPDYLAFYVKKFNTKSRSQIDGLMAGIETFKTTIIEIKKESAKITGNDQATKDNFNATITKNIRDLQNKKPKLDTALKTAQDEFQAKVDAIKSLMDKTQTTAQQLGQLEGELKKSEQDKGQKEASKKKFESAAQKTRKQADSIGAETLELDANQKIRINASNLIVRSDSMKSAPPLLTEDKKKAIMLQPGDIVTPILNENGRISKIQDGPREYIHVTLSDDKKTQGWIALSDKLRGGYKQQYGDNTIEESILNTAQSYRLKGDNIRLRTGFSTRADTLDILENKKVANIQRFNYESTGDNAPEGSKLQWAQVQVTYQDGKKQNGYIAEKFLEPKAA